MLTHMYRLATDLTQAGFALKSWLHYTKYILIQYRIVMEFLTCFEMDWMEEYPLPLADRDHQLDELK